MKLILLLRTRRATPAGGGSDGCTGPLAVRDLRGCAMVTAIRHGCLIGALMAAVLFRFDNREIFIDVAPETQIDSPEAFVAAEACKYLRHAKGLSLPLIFTIQWRKYAPSGAEIPDEGKQVTGVLRSCDPRTEM